MKENPQKGIKTPWETSDEWVGFLQSPSVKHFKRWHPTNICKSKGLHLRCSENIAKGIVTI